MADIRELMTDRPSMAMAVGGGYAPMDAPATYQNVFGGGAGVGLTNRYEAEAQAQLEALQARKNMAMGGMGALKDAFSQYGFGQTVDDLDAGPSARAADIPSDYRVDDLFGTISPFHGQSGGGMQIEGVGSLQAGNEIPAYQAMTQAQVGQSANLVNLLNQIFGTMGNVNIADMTSARNLEGVGKQTDAQRYGYDQGLAGTKYSADADVNKANIAANAQRDVANIANQPALQRLAFQQQQTGPGGLFAEALKSLFHTDGDGKSNVTNIMNPNKGPSLSGLIGALMNAMPQRSVA